MIKRLLLLSIIMLSSAGCVVHSWTPLKKLSVNESPIILTGLAPNVEFRASKLSMADPQKTGGYGSPELHWKYRVDTVYARYPMPDLSAQYLNTYDTFSRSKFSAALFYSIVLPSTNITDFDMTYFDKNKSRSWMLRVGQLDAQGKNIRTVSSPIGDVSYYTYKFQDETQDEAKEWEPKSWNVFIYTKLPKKRALFHGVLSFQQLKLPSEEEIKSVTDRLVLNPDFVDQ